MNLNKKSFKDTEFFIISYGSIIKKELLFRILLDNNSQGIWNNFTPFGFEKDHNQTRWLPLRMTFLKKELLASIDDDHNGLNPSLQSRGLYPIRTKKRKDSYHLKEYIQVGKKYKLNLILKDFKNFIKAAPYFFKIPIKLILKLQKNRKLTYLNKENVELLKFIFSTNNNSQILIITLDNKLHELKKIFKNKKIKIITNYIFDNIINNEIELNPLNLAKNIGFNDENIHNGFQINQKLKTKSLYATKVIIHNKIYSLLSKKQNTDLLTKDILIF